VLAGKCLLVLALSVPRQAPAEGTVTLALSPAPAPVPALRYRLLPDARDLSSANAAALYYRAVIMPQKGFPEDVVKKISDWRQTPLADLPKAEVGKVLEPYRSALQEVALAARRSRCDWDMPLHESSDLVGLVMSELPALRNLAYMVALEARLAVAEGDYARALEALQTGFGLAAHLGEGPTLLHGLVGNAVAVGMTDAVRDWAGRPGSPNLYWALTSLPPQFLDVRGSARVERHFLYHMFPILRDLDKGPFSPERERQLVQALDQVLTMRNEPVKDAEARRKVLTDLITKLHPEAKRHLVGRGLKQEAVDALPPAQAVAAYSAHLYQVVMDDLTKWIRVPFPQAEAGLLKAEDQAKRLGSEDVGGPLVVAAAGYGMVYRNMLRTERRLAALRTLEALRLYAAVRGGKLPATLADITEVPVPADPFTGKPLDYKVEGNKATLSVVAPTGTDPAKFTESYVLTMRGAN
jgi:hypothetical protein